MAGRITAAHGYVCESRAAVPIVNPADPLPRTNFMFLSVVEAETDSESGNEVSLRRGNELGFCP